MAILDAQALTADPDGMAFLADVLGTGGDAAAPGRRFPVEAWTPAIRTEAPGLGTLPRVSDERLAEPV